RARFHPANRLKLAHSTKPSPNPHPAFRFRRAKTANLRKTRHEAPTESAPRTAPHSARPKASKHPYSFPRSILSSGPQFERDQNHQDRLPPIPADSTKFPSKQSEHR